MCGHEYTLSNLDISRLDKNGFPVPDITIQVDDQLIHADLTYKMWCSLVNSTNLSRKRYLDTMLAFLFLRVVLKAKAFYSIDIDYRDLWCWARENINTKWNMHELPQCSLKLYEMFTASESS